MGEANKYVRFGYGPEKKFNHTQGQVSVSMNADIVNLKYTGKWPIKWVLGYELGEYSRSIKTIDWRQK